MRLRFDLLRERLLKAGVAPRHVRRYVRELSDHVADSVAAEKAAGFSESVAKERASGRLGSDDALIAAMVSRREFRSISARAPWLVFGIFPPFFVVLVMLALAFAIMPLIAPYTHPTSHISTMPDWYRFVAAVVCIIENYAMGALCAVYLVGLAERQRMRSLWPKLGCAFAAIAGAYTTTSVAFPQFDGDRNAHFSILVLPSLPLEEVASRLLPTLLIAAAAYWFLKNRTRRAST
jgi:hypothetical protein